jgi:type II secretory pathway pseudopilin PulG
MVFVILAVLSLLVLYGILADRERAEQWRQQERLINQQRQDQLDAEALQALFAPRRKRKKKY